jgi:hypothetical protein
MHRYRRTCRPACRSGFWHATRLAIRVRWRSPDDLGTALTCFRRALYAHRRLVRLAPRFFDSAQLSRERREQEVPQQWSELVNAALLKVYGSASDPPPVPGPPPLPRSRTQLAVEFELASCRAWLGLGHDAWRRFRVRNPHARMSFSRLVCLFELATALGQLAAVTDSAQPKRSPFSAQVFLPLADRKAMSTTNAASRDFVHEYA